MTEAERIEALEAKCALLSAALKRADADARKPMSEIDRDDSRFNQGVTHTVELLAKALGVDNWVAGDGSEDYDEDLQQTLINILAVKGLYDPETGVFAAADTLAALKRLIEVDDDARNAHGKPGANLNGLGLVDLFDCVDHPFGVGAHKQQPYRSINLEVALVDARAAVTKAEGLSDNPGAAEHQWFTYGRLNWECCRACGIVRRADGKNSPCKGPVAVGPRESAARGE